MNKKPIFLFIPTIASALPVGCHKVPPQQETHSQAPPMEITVGYWR